MKIGVYFPRQGEGLADCLRALVPDAEILFYPVQRALPAPEQSARAAALAACDHVLTAESGPEHGALATARLRPAATVPIILPVFSFAGFHPDVTSVAVDGRALHGPTGRYQSRIAITAYLAGLSAAEAERLFNRLVFSKLGYFDAYAVQSLLMAERWARTGADLAPHLARWRAAGCFAHMPDRPKMNVLLDLARIACARMGVAPSQPDIDPARLPDRQARGSAHPVFPAIASSLGVAPEGCFSPGPDAAGQPVALSPAAFLRESYGHFARAPQDSLLAAPGVAEALAALRLQPMARPGKRRPPAGATGLMTYHGTLLRRHGSAPDQLLHRPLDSAGEDAVLLADCTGPAAHQKQQALAGALIRQASDSPLVRVTRGGDYLCAERDSEAAGFSRQEAGLWEQFLPLAPEDLAVLTQIMATDWFLGATGERIPRALIRPVAPFSLRFGRWQVDLQHDFPSLVRGGNKQETRLAILLDGELCHAQPFIGGQAAADQPAAPAPATALRPGGQLVLAGGDAWLAPPVTAGDADRAWLYAAARDSAALDGRAKPTGAVLRRVADEVLGQGAPRGRLPGISVWFCEDGHEASRPAEAALRLHVLSAAAPPEAVYLLPAETQEAFVDLLRALGFGGLKFVRLPAQPVLAADLVYLDMPALAALPAGALEGLRARAGIQASGGRKLAWADGLSSSTLAALAAEGFDVVAADLAPAALPGMVAQAGWVAGVSGGLPNLFCPAGMRVVELCDASGFAGDDWTVSAKLGLMHGVVPCRPAAGGLDADAATLRALLRVMALRS